MTDQSIVDSARKRWGLIIIGIAVLLIIILLVSLLFIPGSQKKFPATETPQLLIVPVIKITQTPLESTNQPDSVTQTESATLPTSEQQLTVGSFRISDIDGMEQLYIPAGEFLMGTNDIEAKREISGGRAYPEIPQFTYFLEAFWLDKYEVTNKQYHKCMEAGACTEPHRIGSYTYPDYFTNPAYDNYPVVWVSWFQATDYCAWADRRLPTEAEWEKAARGPDGRKYPWGNDPYSADKANICDVNCTRTHQLNAFDDGYPDLAPVGSYPAGVSPYGVLDMAGNVWEWNSTEIRDYPYDANDGREDPGGIDVERGWRGSSWANGLWWLRSSVRYHALDFYSWYVLGFRCAASAD
ncbi:MAG: hypothetical protein CVU42_16600 [Chloroflexi bacterium HGW-Chloroflexi-4]|jgi:serine/threonine-protein kinase|nr:MAG: hypothetical protein CVU42_16600 [Chloroflexi bacterium HGW-Chloroflexi-4]